MNRSRLAAVGVSVALAAAVVLAAGESHANATIALSDASIKRKVALRNQSQNPLWISKADCVAGDVMTFSLLLGGSFSGMSLEVWVGGGVCTNVADRASTTATCWQVYKGQSTSTTIDVPISVQDIVANTTKPGQPGLGKLTDCSPESATSEPIAATLYFMFINPSDQANMGGVSWKTFYDLVGPNAPSGVSAESGDTFLKLGWSQSGSTDLVGYNFFCDPMPGAEGPNNTTPLEAGGSTPEASTSDASSAGGTGGSGGATPSCDPDAAEGDASSCDASATDSAVAAQDAATDTSSGQGNCVSTTLVPDGEPDMAYRCGSVTGVTTTEGRVLGLTNKMTYTIAVAAYDGVGNVGKLSNLACGEPYPVDDFFKLYKQAGGEGGGSFCSVGAVGQGAGMVGFGVMAIAALARIARRRREDS